MSSLSEMRDSIADKEKLKKKYLKRIEQIQEIQSSTNSDLEYEVEAVNKKLTALVEKQKEGFGDFVYLGQVNTSILNDKEDSAYSDEMLIAVQSNLSKDISNCETKIEEIELEIKNLHKAIEEEEEAERQREENARREALNRERNRLR